VNPKSPSARLRALLAGDRCVTAASLFDPMSARVADDIGFEVGVIGGSVASLAVLGDPDLILLTLTELAEQARRVCRAGKLCVIVDADHGYGNALNVMRTTQELQGAGVAGVTIEDTLLPRAHGASQRPGLISIEEGVGKMKAALRSREDSAGSAGALIFGRTGASAVTGLDDAIRRLLAYEDAGVDALFVPGLKERDDLDRIAAAVRLPIILGGCHERLADPHYLASRNVKIWLGGHQAFAAAVQAVHATLSAVYAGTLPSQLQNVASADLMGTLTRAEVFERWTSNYLSPPQ
jgi:carboxyvinyl-carboxyphosphonate phosphorylmutase